MKNRRLTRGALIAAGTLVAVAGAHAQPNPPVPSVGPDVIVSGIDGLTRYGTVNGVTGYAMTTVSCNIGDANAVWVDGPGVPNDNRTYDPMNFSQPNPNFGQPLGRNQHPVISQTMYRYQVRDGAGRFEHIGMAWLKHGWCAADSTAGGGCISLADANPETPGVFPRTTAGISNCDWLGRYATDTYGASLNAAQQDLGPRSEVNAFTGAFPYPYIRAWNQQGNATFKRLQIANVDLDPALNPNSRYFAEVHYVTVDEMPKRRINNASYREAFVGTVTNGGYNMNFSGGRPMVAQYSGIYAWKAIDPAVQLSVVDVPGEGRFIVGGKATDLGNGQWDYEYAVYNMNSDLSAGWVSVPAQCGTSISNVGFKDVVYHSGEEYDDTPWASTVGNGAVAWAVTQNYSENVNANALRWSTTYNFRFVANAAPVNGAMTIGMFKPGAVSSVLAGGLPIPGAATGCRADFDSDGTVNTADITAFLSAWFADRAAETTASDFDCSGQVNTADITAFLSSWFEARASGC